MALNFELRRSPKHAIAEFTASIHLFQPINPDTFSRVIPRVQAAAQRLNLPAPMPVQMFNLTVGPTPPQAIPVTAVGFQRFASNGEIECSLRATESEVVFALRDYERWATHLPILIETFSEVITPYLNEAPAIKGLGVGYTNEFRSKKPGLISSAEIFRAESKWLAPFRLDGDQAWHCHVGQFMPAAADCRFLVNINCDVRPVRFPQAPAVQTYVKVFLSVFRQYDVSGPLLLRADQLKEALGPLLESTHSLEKKLLGEVVSDLYLDVLGEGARDC